MNNNPTNYNRRRITIREFGVLLAIFLVIILVVLYFFNSNRIVSTTENTKGIQISNGGRNEYSTVVKDGRYLTSKARGVTATSTGNQFNVTSFQNGLINISKSQFRPSSYIFQEGQYLSSDTVQKWLDRYSNDQKDGLNPEDNGKTDDSRNPIYLQSIEEQDFVNQDGNKLKLEGMTIGLSMNTVDTYTREEYGPTFSQEIPFDQMQSEGRKIAKKVLERVRKLKDVSDDIPIMIAIYANQPPDSLVGGTFYEYAVSSNGVKLDKWQTIDSKNVVFPKLDDDQDSLGDDENTNFVNFKTEIQNFFPNLSSTTAQAHYENGYLQGMNVEVVTQFYASTEIRAFTTYIAEAAPKYLPDNIPTRIIIKTSNNIQAILTSDGGAYSIMYLDSY